MSAYTSGSEINIAWSAVHPMISRTVIYSQGLPILPGGTYPMMGTVIRNADPATSRMNTILTLTRNGIVKNSEMRHTANCTGDTEQLENSRILNWKNS